MAERSPQDIVRRWELTPLENMKGFTFSAQQSIATLAVEAKPFTSKRIDLEGTDLQLQVAISDATANHEMVAVRAVVGSLLISRGRATQEQTRLVILPDFRGARLGQLLTTEWHKRSARFVDRGVEKLNLASVGPYIDAHLATCRWAVEQGLPVPDRVREELETGFEEMVLRGLAAGVKHTGELVVVSADSASKLPPPGVNDGKEARVQLARSPTLTKPR